MAVAPGSPLMDVEGLVGDPIEISYTAVAADESGRMLPPEEEGCWSKTQTCSFCNEKCLDVVTGIVIFINVVLMGMELDIPWAGYSYIEQVMLCIYILDVFLRMRWSGFREYMCDRAHLVDIAIVSASVIEIWVVPLTIAVEQSLDAGHHKTKKRGSIAANMTMVLRGFRLVRAVRLIKLVKFARPLYMILQSMSAAMSRVAWVMVLIGVFLYAFSLIFTQLLGRDMLDALPDDDLALTKIRQRFNTVPRTFFELFRVMCGDVTDFGYLVSAEDNVVVPLMYITFQVTTPWLILAIFTAEVVDTTISTSQKLNKEEVAMRALHTRTVHRQRLSDELFDLFADVQCTRDAQMSHVLELDTLATFLEDAYNVDRLNEITGLTAFQAINAWEAIESGGGAHMEDYVDGLVLASHQSQEHSILRMEAQIRAMLRNQAALLEVLEVPGQVPFIKNKERQSVADAGIGQPNYASVPKPPPKGMISLWEEMSDMRSEIRTGLVQLSSGLQAVQSDQSGLRRGMTATKDAEQKVVTEVRKMQRDLSESNSQIHGTLLGISDVRNDISALCKQGIGQPAAKEARSPQIDELLGEVHQLRNEVTHVARTEDMGQLADVLLEVQKMQENFSASNFQIQSALSGMSDIRDEISKLCEKNSARESSQIKELISEVQNLSDGVADLAEVAGDSGSKSASPEVRIAGLDEMLSSSIEMREGFKELQGRVAGLDEIPGRLDEMRAGFMDLQDMPGRLDEMRAGFMDLQDMPGRLDEMRVGFMDLQGGFDSLRTEIVTISDVFSQSLRSDQPSGGESGGSSASRDLSLSPLKVGACSAFEPPVDRSEDPNIDPRTALMFIAEGEGAASSSTAEAVPCLAQDGDRLWNTEPPLLTETGMERPDRPASVLEASALSDRQNSTAGRRHSDSPLLERLRRERRNYSGIV